MSRKVLRNGGIDEARLYGGFLVAMSRKVLRNRTVPYWTLQSCGVSSRYVAKGLAELPRLKPTTALSSFLVAMSRKVLRNPLVTSFPPALRCKFLVAMSRKVLRNLAEVIAGAVSSGVSSRYVAKGLAEQSRIIFLSGEKVSSRYVAKGLAELSIRG